MKDKDNVQISVATIQDLKTVQLLNNKLFQLEYDSGFDETLLPGWPLTAEGEEYFADLIKNKIVFLAKRKNEVIGYLAGGIAAEDSYVTVKFGKIENIFVDEKYRKFGVGTKLIDVFKDYCLGKGADYVKVTAYALNERAINFYRKNGFEVSDVTLRVKIKP